MALNDPNAPLLFDPLAPTWDDEREAAFMASLFGPPAAPVVPVVPADPSAALAAAPAPEPIAPTPPAPAPQQIGPVLSGPTQDEQLARNPEQELPAFARPIEEPPTIELPFAADAVSGVDQPPPPEAATSTSPMPTERPIEEEQDPIAQAQRWVDLSQTDPEGFQRAMMAHDLERQRELNTRTEQIAADDAAAAERGRQRVLEAQQRAEQLAAQVEADAAELAKQKVDPGRWWASRNTGQKIAGFIAAIVGGLAQSSSGGRNVGLDMINAEIDRDIEAQKTNIANGRADIMRRQGVVSELFARTGDLERSVEAARRAAKEQALQQLEIEMMKFDPNGTAARQIAQQVLTGRAEQAQANEKWRQQQFENQLKAGELAVKVDEQNRKWQERADKLAKAGAGSGPVLPPEYFEQHFGLRPPTAMTEKDFDELLQRRGKVKALNKPDSEKSAAQVRKEEAEATKAEAEADAARSGFAIASPETGEALTQKDGAPFVVMDATERQRLRGITTAAANIRRLADKIEEVRKKTGGGSKALGSDDYQELQSLAKAVDFETYKAFDLGAPSAGDTEMAEGIRGGVDLTTFLKDPKKGMQTYADSVEKKALAHLRGAGYTGSALRFRRASDLKAAVPSVVDEIGGRLTSSLLELPSNPDASNPLAQYNAQLHGAIVGPQNEQTEEDLQKLAAYAEQPNEQGDLARNYLRQLADRAVYPDVKARAKAILDALPGAHVRRDEAR